MHCAYCGHKNRPGMLFCEDCGQLLFEQDQLPTKRLSNTKQRLGSDEMGPILLHIRGGDEPIPLQRPARIVIGRYDANTPGEEPDLDLTPYGAPDKGVSRRHATFDTLSKFPTLIDMGSSNGTFVNGQKLMPHQPCVVRDGDEIRLGRLVARVYLK